MKQLAVNWLEKNVLAKISAILFLCFMIACVPFNDKSINAQTQLQLGLTYIQLHQYGLAETSLQNALRFKRNYFDGERALAYLYQVMGKSEKATYFYQKIIQKHPSPEAYNNYGVFLCQQKKYSNAIMAFQRALRYETKNQDIQHNLNLCRSSASKKDEEI